MRKQLLTLIAIVISLTGVFAQHDASNKEQHDHDHEGLLFIGGALNLWNNSETSEKSLALHFCPEVGYLFNDTWGVGVLLGYDYSKGVALHTHSLRSEHDHDASLVSQKFKVSPFVRYYYYHNGPFNLYFDGGFGLNFMWDNHDEHKAKEEHNHNIDMGYEVGVRPGACLDLVDGLCLCIRFGFIGYRNNYTSGEEPMMGSTGWGIRFAPEEAMIGLELEF